MGFVSKLIGNGKHEASAAVPSGAYSELADGAIDTLSNVMQVMGKESFPLEDQLDENAFPAMCAEFARHVENGAAVPSCDIPASQDGGREWPRVRRFFADRRRAEKDFVNERLSGYRGIVDDLVSGLRDVGHRDQDTETSVMRDLTAIEDAVNTGDLPNVKNALAETITKVNDTFAEQKRTYEKQLQELNERMSSMRQDLVQVREEMKRDPLTEAFNRGAFDAAVLQCLNLHFILQQPVTLMMIDLDDFKIINDTYGHSAGDEVLRSIGECLARAFIRKNDIVARYGGDEFAVILPDTSAEHSAPLIERFLDSVRQIRIPYANEDAKVSCSIGYTEVADNDTVEQLINRADRGLYAAKAAGRDRGIFVSPGADDPGATN